MKASEIRRVCQPLINLDSIESCHSLLKIFLDYFLLVIVKHNQDVEHTAERADAKIIHQMIFTKTLSIKRLLEGLAYKSSFGPQLNSVIDPTSIGPLIRSIYETVCLFNMIFRQPTNEAQKKIIYNLWVISGLKYRQSFSSFYDQPVQKLQEESQEIKNLIAEIEELDYFKKLDEKSQKNIQTKIKKKDFKIHFENDAVHFLSWQDVSSRMGLREGNDLFENVYNYFSHYSHPTVASVFQFESMFSGSKKTNEFLSKANMLYVFSLLSFFIADYIFYFPQVLKTFEEQELTKQILLNWHNQLHRGESFAINECWKEYG